MIARVFPLVFRLVVLLVLPAAMAGCSDSPTAPTSYAPFSKTDLRVGTGTEAANGNVVTVRYTGWLYDASKTEQKGLMFDTSAGQSGYSFTLGAGAVITGWDQGVLGMRGGGLRRLVVPPSLAYGASRNGSIPPYATLLFEIELLNVQ